MMLLLLFVVVVVVVAAAFLVVVGGGLQWVREAEGRPQGQALALCWFTLHSSGHL
jgi:hypothetical protein